MIADVVVLGAGPAGLAAAWYATRRGLSVAVIDRATHVGGLAASIVVDGQRVDLGSHRLHPSIRPDLLADLQRLLGGTLQSRPRNGRIRLDGRWVAFPLNPSDFVRNAPPRFAMRVAADLATSPLRRRAGAESDGFLDAARRGMGPTLTERFYGPYARKLFGVAPQSLSAELYRRRLGARDVATVARRALRRGPRQTFWYPAGGFGQICERLAEDVAELGGDVRLATTIDRVDAGASGVTVMTARGQPIEARTLISTIPPGDLATLAGAGPDVIEASHHLVHRGALLVYLSVPHHRYTPFDAHYFPQPDVSTARLSEPKGYRESRDDPADRSVLCAELPATVGDESWTAPADELADRVVRDLVACGLPDPAPRAVHVERRARVYPVYLHGFERDRAVFDRWVDELPNVAVIGRQGLFAHDNTHHALLTGHVAAICIGTDGRLDADAWRSRRATFADHVVED
ncbi:MAG: protoporphyrinogen/coproporphyrinogen oxidase [Acidimicrobiales bacterium]